MTKKLLLFILLFSSMPVFSQNAENLNLEAYFSHCSFHEPDGSPYTELYLGINGNSIVYDTNGRDMLQGNVLVTYIFWKGDSIYNYSKIELSSPEYSNDLQFNSLFDLQRLSLDSGHYALEILLADKANEEKIYRVVQEVVIPAPSDSIYLSDIEMVDEFAKKTEGSLVKNGLEIKPYLSTFYPPNKSRLSFYFEVYNSNQVLGDSSQYLVRYYLRNFETGEDLFAYSNFKRLFAAQVSPVVGEFDISELPTGQFLLIVEVRDRNNVLHANFAQYFERSNPNVSRSMADLLALNTASTFVEEIGSGDTLSEYVNCLRPIAQGFEIDVIDRLKEKGTDDEKRKFFYAFWLDRNDVEPEAEWLEYKKNVEQANRFFSTSISKGYETDRGLVYLRFGPPNSMITRENEPSSYPYEIWHYEIHPKRTDARYIFYNTDLVTNDYRILHSNVIGEVNNPRWQLDLQRRTNPFGSVDDVNGRNHYGGNAGEYYNMPR